MIDRARYARHLTLAGIGEEGQEKLGRATASVPAAGLAGAVATRYAERAGFGRVEAGPPGEGLAPEFVTTQAAREVVEGSLAALEALRRACLPSTLPPP